MAYFRRVILGVELIADTYGPIEIHKIKSRGQFDEMVKAKAKYFQLSIGLDILDLRLTPTEAVLFNCLGKLVGYNHMVYTTTRELLVDVGCTRKTLVDCLFSLESRNLIRQVGVELEGKGDRLILVNPRYFFKGYYPYREELIKRWYLG
jgi:hypothetical protein